MSYCRFGIGLVHFVGGGRKKNYWRDGLGIASFDDSCDFAPVGTSLKVEMMKKVDWMQVYFSPSQIALMP